MLFGERAVLLYCKQMKITVAEVMACRICKERGRECWPRSSFSVRPPNIKICHHHHRRRPARPRPLLGRKPIKGILSAELQRNALERVACFCGSAVKEKRVLSLLPLRLLRVRGRGSDPGPGGSRMTSKSSTESVTRFQFHARSILDMQAVRRNNDVRP